MAITNPFSLVYGTFAVGGDSDLYLLHGPYTIDKSYEAIRIVFDVVVTTDSYKNLKKYSEALEDAFAKRDQDLVINISGAKWIYVNGAGILNSTASASKSGDTETDRGYSRSYTCVVEGGRPAFDRGGLRDFQMNVGYEASRQKIVTMQGTYTAGPDEKLATPGSSSPASARYKAGIDAEALIALTLIGGSDIYELVDENYTKDRNDHVCQFHRQYMQLLDDGSLGGLIVDHRMVFTDLSQHPGDSKEDVHRLRRAVASYEGALNVGLSREPKKILEAKVKKYVLGVFSKNFQPTTFGIEELRMSFDTATNRVSMMMQLLYQKKGGEDLVEVSQSLAYRETRTIDYTPVHDGAEYAAEVDVGWAVLERIASRTAIVLGEEEPRRRLGKGATKKESKAGKIEGIEGGPDVTREGWNIIQNLSQTTDRYIGDPDQDQVRVTVLTETVVERFSEKPKLATPITPQGRGR